MINKLYISTMNHDWKNADSILIDSNNLRKIIDKIEAINCHTSVEDLNCENINVACNSASEIILIDINESTNITPNNFFAYGRLFNELVRHKNKIKNFPWNKEFAYLRNTRLDNSPVLWTAGCSITEGYGVGNNERWGKLLSGYLNLPEITLSKNGSSIFWSADQILRSDIREGDTVVWGLTNIPRVEVANDWNFDSITIAEYLSIKKEHQYWTLDYFESESQVLMALRNILQVINFCQKVKSTLYLANMFDVVWISVMLSKFENFIDLTQDLAINGTAIEFIDLGSDNLHPGPIQHWQYATKIYNFIKENNHGQTI